MLIKRILRDAKGVTVTFPPNSAYVFSPDSPYGPFIAKVENPAHAERLLAIPEGYREVAQPFIADADPIEDADTADAELGADADQVDADPLDDEGAQPDDQTPEGDSGDSDAAADADTAVADQADADGARPDEQADAAGTDIADEPGDEPAQPEVGTAADLPDFTAMSDEQLRAQFEASVGRRAAANAGRATMIKQITAALSGE